MKKLCLILVLLITNICAAQDNHLSPLLKRLDQIIQHNIQQKKVIGCAVAVVFQGKIVFIKAYGVRKKGEKAPVNLNTVFQLGSTSKPISASLVALLQKQQLIALNASVADYCPYVLPETQIHHLLSHTSGYKRTGWNLKIEAGQPRNQLLDQLARTEQSTPGEVFDYHNVVYSLLEELVEKIFQQSFKDVLTEQLFRPLRMAQTSVGYTDFQMQRNRAWPHQRDKHQQWYPSKSYSRFYHEAVCSAGGINSTIKDMAIFLQLQLGEIPHILNTQDLSHFHTPATIAPDAQIWFKKVVPGDVQSYYGYGWRIAAYNQENIVFHGGWLKGFSNFLGFMPAHQIGIVILNNAESNFAFKTAIEFFDLIQKNNK